jgi:hypothetical protein
MVSLFFIVTLAGYGCVGVGKVWLCGYGFWQGFMQVEGRESEREKHFQKSSSSLPLHAQGRRSCTVSFKTAPCSLIFFFFFEEKKKNLRVTQK